MGIEVLDVSAFRLLKELGKSVWIKIIGYLWFIGSGYSVEEISCIRGSLL